MPRDVSFDPDKVRLGERLFHDVRLSHGDVLACALLPRAGRWRRRQPGPRRALDGELLDFNAPTVFNVALSFRLNWRGNFRTLEEQTRRCCSTPAS